MAIVLPMYGNVGHGNMWNSMGNRIVGFGSPSVVINHTQSVLVTYYTPALETHLLTITPKGPEQKDRGLSCYRKKYQIFFVESFLFQVADPEFSRGAATIYILLPDFPENCMQK